MLMFYSEVLSFIMLCDNDVSEFCNFIISMKEEDNDDYNEDQYAPYDTENDLYDHLNNNENTIIPCRYPSQLHLIKPNISLEYNVYFKYNQRYVLSYNCENEVYYITITCPFCHYHPNPSILYNVIELYCKKCKFYELCINKEDEILDNKKCYCNNELNTNNIRKAWKCLSCGTITSAKCNISNNSNYDKNIKYVIKCQNCNELNIIDENKELHCLECEKLLPTIQYQL